MSFKTACPESLFSMNEFHERFEENFPLSDVIDVPGCTCLKLWAGKIFLPTHPTLFWGRRGFLKVEGPGEF